MKTARSKQSHEPPCRFSDLARPVLKETPRTKLRYMDGNDSGAVWQIVFRQNEPADLERAGPWLPLCDNEGQPPRRGRTMDIQMGKPLPPVAASEEARSPMKILPGGAEGEIRPGGVRRIAPLEQAPGDPDGSKSRAIMRQALATARNARRPGCRTTHSPTPRISAKLCGKVIATPRSDRRVGSRGLSRLNGETDTIWSEGFHGGVMEPEQPNCSVFARSGHRSLSYRA
mmetsp:Transcript_85989/g.223500  ORF Transcript_85989/g.223500 Transcript_85989/m.223500 type:complete len:229 (-) Transcript_85989:101-787(-)